MPDIQTDKANDAFDSARIESEDHYWNDSTQGEQKRQITYLQTKFSISSFWSEPQSLDENQIIK